MAPERELITPDGPPPPRPSVRAPDPPAAADAAGRAEHDMALKFVGRVAQLSVDETGAVVETWREVMREASGAWFDAEELVARAVIDSGRRDVQKGLLMHVAEAFAYGVWYGRGAGAAPETRVRATESSGQYLATLAMIALLVRDHLDAATFEVAYRPFRSLIPVAELRRE